MSGPCVCVWERVLEHQHVTVKKVREQQLCKAQHDRARLRLYGFSAGGNASARVSRPAVERKKAAG